MDSAPINLTKIVGRHMLVLSRKPCESVVIGDEVKVSVLSVRGKIVRLGIEAPRDVTVNREEIHLRIQASLENPDSPDTVNTRE